MKTKSKNKMKVKGSGEGKFGGKGKGPGSGPPGDAESGAVAGFKGKGKAKMKAKVKGQGKAKQKAKQKMKSKVKVQMPSEHSDEYYRQIYEPEAESSEEEEEDEEEKDDEPLPMDRLDMSSFAKYADLSEEAGGIFWVCFQADTVKKDVKKYRSMFLNVNKQERWKRYPFVYLDMGLEGHYEESGCEKDKVTIGFQMQGGIDDDEVPFYRKVFNSTEELTEGVIDEFMEDALMDRIDPHEPDHQKEEAAFDDGKDDDEEEEEEEEGEEEEDPGTDTKDGETKKDKDEL